MVQTPCVTFQKGSQSIEGLSGPVLGPVCLYVESHVGVQNGLHGTLRKHASLHGMPVWSHVVYIWPYASGFRTAPMRLSTNAQKRPWKVSLDPCCVYVAPYDSPQTSKNIHGKAVQRMASSVQRDYEAAAASCVQRASSVQSIYGESPSAAPANSRRARDPRPGTYGAGALVARLVAVMP